MILPEEYTALMQSQGVSLERMGLKSRALSKPDALRAVEILRNTMVVVLGGDVLWDSNGKITFTGDSWYYQKSGKPINQANLESCAKATSFLETYKRPGEGRALFDLVVSAYGVPGAK